MAHRHASGGRAGTMSAAHRKPQALLASCFGALVLSAGWAAAEEPPKPDERAVCLDSHENAQTLRFQGQLLGARESLRVCSRDICPGAIRKDCAEWLEKVQFAVPSVVFAAHSPAGDETEVRVRLGEAVLAERLSGAPQEMNPGLYTLRFERAGFDPVAVRVVVREGEKNRVVSAEFAARAPAAPLAGRPSPQQSSPAPAPAPYRPIPVAAYVFGGIAALSAGGAVLFGALANSAHKDATERCAPNCAASEVESIRSKALASDVFLGGAVLSAGLAGLLVFTRPIRERPAPPATAVLGLQPSPQGLSFTVGGRF